MATMTITGDLRKFGFDPSETTELTIRSNAQVVDTDNDVVYDEQDTIVVTNAELSYECPAPGDGIEPSAFGYIITEAKSGYRRKWQIPATAGPVDISDYTETTPLPLDTAETILDSAVAARDAAQQAATAAEESADNAAAAAETAVAPVAASLAALASSWARDPDLLIAGTITRDANGAATSAPVVWPDGTPGTFTADDLSTDFPGAVDGYHITYGSPATATYTQPTITRDASGAATNVPQIVVT